MPALAPRRELRQWRRDEWSGVTGCFFQEEFVIIRLGKVLVAWDGKNYLPYRQAQAVVRESQKPNSLINETGVILRVAIARRLDIDPFELKFFGAVGTCFDVKHGVDFFFDWCPSSSCREPVTVTFDATMNPNKRSYKADVVIGREDVENEFLLAATSAATKLRERALRCR